MKYDKMWYTLKEELMQIHDGGDMNIEDLLFMMNRIEVEENKNSNTKILNLGVKK